MCHSDTLPPKKTEHSIKIKGAAIKYCFVQVLRHIKGEKGSEMIYLGLINFKSQKPGILRRIVRLYINCIPVSLKKKNYDEAI